MTPINDLDVGDDLRYYLDGVPYTGDVVETGPAGNLMSSVSMVDGWPHGVERVWYPTGELKSEVTVVRGNSVGVGRRWHRNGTLAQELRYHDDGTAAISEWDEDGTPLSR